MAKKTSTAPAKTHLAAPKRKRPNRHSKKRSSNLKSSKNYTKKYVGQGR